MNRGLVNVHEGESWGVTLGASSSWPLRTFQNRTLLGLGGNWPRRRARACWDCPVPELGLAPELEPTGLYELGYDELMLVPLGVGSGMCWAGLGWAKLGACKQLARVAPQIGQSRLFHVKYGAG